MGDQHRPSAPIEYYDTFEQAKARFDALRQQPYNQPEEEQNQDGQPYARLTMGVDCTDQPSAADLIHVCDDKNTLVDDFTRVPRLNTDRSVLDALKQIAAQIGIDTVMVYEQNTKPQFHSFAEWSQQQQYISEKVALIKDEPSPTSDAPYRYYITASAVSQSAYPQPDNAKVTKSVHLASYEQGTVQAYGYVDYPAPLPSAMVRACGLKPSNRNLQKKPNLGSQLFAVKVAADKENVQQKTTPNHNRLKEQGR